jgi:5-methylcytosine-specific restriction endonuclease McrA
MSAHLRVTNDQIIEAYNRTGSIWKAAKSIGIGGQSLHERLVHMGVPMKHRRWTGDEDDELITLLDNRLTVGQIGSQLGRTFAAVACRMNELNLSVKSHDRKRKLPRSSGYDKASVLKAMKSLELSLIPVTRFARANGLNADSLVYALGVHCPDRWQAHVAATSPYPNKTCPNCSRDFVPMSGKQVYCTRSCSTHALKDREYFGGKRNTTIGLAEGVCQLCSRKVEKGLSSHHVLGKENDPDNNVLIALCPGCHKLVGLIATRLFLDSTSAWETLIALAIMRRDGPKIAAGEYDSKQLATYVEIKWESADEAEDDDEVA